MGQEKKYEEFLKLCRLTIENIDRLFRYFEVDYTDNYEFFSARCPIHGSDNDSSLCVYKESEYGNGKWECFTKQCNEIYGNSIIGFIRGCLSVKKNKNIDMHAAIVWLKKFLKFNENTKIDYKPLEIKNKKLQTILDCTRQQIRNYLKIPSPYFLKRGYSKNVLDEFDVGECLTKGKPMYQRAVCPVYNEEEQVLGAVGRRLVDKSYLIKWLPHNIRKSQTFYGLHKSAPFIRESKTVVLVEGPPDFLRMWSAGINNTLGLFGISLSNHKAELLKQLKVANIILALDKDESGAGQTATKRIIKKFQEEFYIQSVEPPKQKDFGETSENEIQSLILPNLERL